MRSDYGHGTATAAAIHTWVTVRYKNKFSIEVGGGIISSTLVGSSPKDHAYL